MEFDTKAFIEQLAKSRSLNKDQRADLVRAARAACGEEILPPLVPGDVLKSTRGVRLVISIGYNKLTLVSLKVFEPSQNEEVVGIKIAQPEMSPDVLEEYCNRHGYTRVGRVENLNLNDVTANS